MTHRRSAPAANENIGEEMVDNWFTEANPARILPLNHGAGDHRLLEEWIANQETYEVVDSDSPSTATFDLCIVDAHALEKHLAELRSVKSEAAPVLLPYLLLLPEHDASIIEADNGELADNILRATIDEVVSLPLKKVELGWRVQALLRQRSHSLQLRAAERGYRRFKRAAEAAGHAVYITDPHGTIEYVNPAFEEITGFSREEAIGENPRLLNSGEMAEDYFDELWETVTSGAVWEEVVINQRKNGDIYYADQTVAPITSPNDDIEAIVAVQNDITERKRRMETLEEYKQAVESSKDLLAAVDPDFEFLFANETYCEYHGVESVDITGESLADVIGEKRFSAVEQNVRAALNGDEVQREITRDHPDMGERILDVDLFPIYSTDGDILGGGASMRDVTERKRLEEDLRESKERYESLFTSIRDAILVADTDRRIINCNPAFTELFGYELDEIEGRPTKVVYESEEEFKELVEAIDSHIDDPQFTYTVSYEKKSGQVFPGETNVFYLRDQADEIIGFIGVIRDVTDRQNRLKQLQLIDRVLQHNFHNDMTIIDGNAELIRSKAESTLSTYADNIIETSHELLETVEKEREITKFLSDPPPTETIDISSALDDVVEDVQTERPTANISINYDEGIHVRANVAIERAIVEILSNAIVHSEADKPAVELTVETSEERVLIEVTDENRRIPDMERAAITGEEESSTLYHGSGLGLWLVKLIVDRSEGVLALDEKEPQGNVVRVELPAA